MPCYSTSEGYDMCLWQTRSIRYDELFSHSQKLMIFQLLRGAHDKLNHELRPPKSVDPLTQLPIEIVEMIVGYLHFYELA